MKNDRPAENALAKRGKTRRDVLMTGLRIFGYSLALGFVSLMFAPIMMSENAFIRIFFNLALLLIAGILYFSDGAYKGERDCATREMLGKRVQTQGYVLTPSERERLYRTAKGPLAALIGAAPWLLVAIAVAILATPYTYSLQDLPNWLSGYRFLPEVGNPLLYYDRQVVVPLVDWLRIGLRFVMLPFIYLLGNISDAASLLLDRLSPLIVCLLPACFAVGYLTGPRRHRRTQKYLADIKAKPRKRLKKNRKQRGPKKDEKNQLI